MATLCAYFDESGTHNASPIIVVGGVIASASSWTSLSAQWDKVLLKYKVTEFHSTDYNAKQKEFKNWPDEKLCSFFEGLLEIIKKERLIKRAVIFEKRDLQNALKNYPELRLTDYQFGCYTCLAQISKFYRSKEHANTLEVYFEAGQPFYNEIIDFWVRHLSKNTVTIVEELGIKSIIRKKEGCFPPLQVADMVVYEQYKRYTQPRNREQTQRLYDIINGEAPKLTFYQIDAILSIISKMLV